MITASQYWTEENIADGLNALAICIEMVIFSAFMMYAYTWHEYKIPGQTKTNPIRPLIDRCVRKVRFSTCMLTIATFTVSTSVSAYAT